MMPKILRALVIVLALCVPAFAGEIPMPPAPQPAPSVDQPAEEPPADGDTRTEEPGDLTETLLSVIKSVLALF